MSDKKRRTARPVQKALDATSIAERAYALWIARGCPISDGTQDWFAAQAQLSIEHTPLPKRVKASSAATRLAV
jgi:hypothetical protein